MGSNGLFCYMYYRSYHRSMCIWHRQSLTFSCQRKAQYLEDRPKPKRASQQYFLFNRTHSLMRGAFQLRASSPPQHASFFSLERYELNILGIAVGYSGFIDSDSSFVRCLELENNKQACALLYRSVSSKVNERLV